MKIDSSVTKPHKDRGITLLELLITLSIFSLSVFFIYYNYQKFNENNELFKGKLILVNTISKYRDLAYYDNTMYNIQLDFLRKKLIIYDRSFIEVSLLELPKNINYKIINREHTPFSHVTNITPNGNLGSSFTIYIFDYKNIARYRIAFYSFSQIKYLTINTYKNHSASDATFANISLYHSTSSGQNHIGWIKE